MGENRHNNQIHHRTNAENNDKGKIRRTSIDPLPQHHQPCDHSHEQPDDNHYRQQDDMTIDLAVIHLYHKINLTVKITQIYNLLPYCEILVNLIIAINLLIFVSLQKDVK